MTSTNANRSSALMVSWSFALFLTVVLAQTFTDYPITNSWPGISDTCAAALNTTVACAGILGAVSADQPRLNAQNLSSLCENSCLNSLNNVKQTIENSCTLTTDVILLDSHTYPATYLVDLFIYTYSLSCRLDSTSGEYCDILFTEWLNQDSLTAAQNCSDCMLGVTQIQLDSSFGYDSEFAEDFEARTSSCGATGYPFTSPMPYTVPMSTSSPTSTTSTVLAAIATAVLDPSCVTLYTIQANDTCDSIALSQNVSTYAVYGPNGIADCSNLPTGFNLCLLGQCLQYQVQKDDTCDTIIARSGSSIRPDIFVAWNPNINPLCTNLDELESYYICMSRPTGLLNPNITIVNSTASAAATDWPTIAVSAEVQLPTAVGTVAGCLKYTNYKNVSVVQDQYYSPQYQFTSDIANDCNYISAVNAISLEKFIEWNPSLDDGSSLSNCTLDPGFSYCVSYGNDTGIQEPTLYPCYSADASIVPAGTTESCSCFWEYHGDDNGYLFCEDIEDQWNITSSEMLDWNSWLGSDCDTALFIDLNSTSDRALCVGTTESVNSSSLITTLEQLSTTTSPSISLSTSTGIITTTAATTSTPGSVCIKGTGDGNYLDLCNYCCSYGYCPPGPCTCTEYGQQVPTPAATWAPGYPITGEDNSFDGLCRFACNHGYCPPEECTTTAR